VPEVKLTVQIVFDERDLAPGEHRHEAPDDAGPRCSTHEAGISPRHAEGDGLTGLTSGALSGVPSDGGLSGVTSDGESYRFISVSASFARGTPLTRARIPC